MRKCPTCGIDLTPVDYEGFRVMQCEHCHGHLVPSLHLEGIKRVDRKSLDELKTSASSQFKGNSPVKLTCPACRMLMDKKRIKLSVVTLQADVCKHCSLVWLDGGELALLQLGYQATAKFLNAQDLKRKIKKLNTDPERKARFEANLAKLPDSMEPFEAAMNEMGEEVLGAIIRGMPTPRIRIR